MGQLSDETIERIWAEAEEAALHSSPYNPAKNPYPAGSQKAKIWIHAYGHFLTKEWH